ncbi:CHASE domain-containing protein [Solirhodobacter olei]|uniref:CHASE domain-containing protein n=1 Tax=Solirhodobacter olei TaxID=2493082 RepID=UPI000FD7E7FA|nr:CHASE domain-containing protein [Solirhodobacter olei]
MTTAEDAPQVAPVSPDIVWWEWCLYAVGFLLFCTAGLVAKPAYADAVVMPRGAGIALALLLVLGRRHWPMILAISLLGWLAVMRASGIAFDAVHVLSAVGIAGVQTAQAWTGAFALRRRFGFPMCLDSGRDVALAALVILPPISMAAAALGLLIFLASGDVAPSGLLSNWIVWWVGDLIGIYIALPLALLWPFRAASHFYWKGGALPRFKTSAIYWILLSLLVTMAGWQAVTSLIVNFNKGEFETLVHDNRGALDNRLQSIAFALDGAKGLIEGSQSVNAQEWRKYCQTLNVQRRLPGVMGIGLVVPVANADLPAFEANEQHLGAGDLKIHPPSDRLEHFVVQYFEPLAINPGALGLDIAANPDGHATALAARDSGDPRITRGMSLIGEPDVGPGFLLFDPIYKSTIAPTTQAGRIAGFYGWVYAPIPAAALVKDLSSSQHKNLAITLYDSSTIAPEHLIYSAANDRAHHPAYRVVQKLPVFGRTWTIVWQSTPAFENSVNRATASVTLAGGLAFTALLGFYLLTLTRREDKISAEVAARTRELAAQIEENRAIIQTPNANIAMMDAQGRILFTNEAFTHLFAAPGTELRGRPLAALLDGATADYFGWSSQRSEPTSFRAEVRATDARGERVILDVLINAWLSAEGERRYTALITDVTDKRRVEQELRHAQHRLDVALTGAKIGVFELDLATNVSIVSPTWKLLFGFASDQEIDAQAEFFARIHPDDRPALEEADRQCIEGKTERSISEIRLRVVDGSWRWFRSEAVVGERDASGRATRLIGAMTDIQELVASKEALRTSEERFRSAIEAAPVGTALIALDGRFLKVNNALSGLVGMPEAEILKIPFHQFLHADDRPAVREQVAELLAGKCENFAAEIRCLHAEGYEVWGNLSLALVRDGMGRPDNFVAQVQDITEQKKVERIKNEFVATVSHELRTPLTSINGSLGLVLNGVAGTVPEKAHKMLSIAHKNCSRLILLVNDILDMEKLSSGKMTFDLVEAPIGQLVAQSAADTRPYAEPAGVRFVLTEPEEELYARVDTNRFQQIMANLLSNAVKFSPPGGAVEIATERLGGLVRVTVTDHGSGVPVEFRSKIFGAFSQADSSSTRKKPGTGLGLSITRQMVERMGGTIGFDSEPDVETTFWFTLPLSNTHEAATTPLEKTEPIPAVDRPRILHVDEDSDFSHILAASFGTRAEIVHARSLVEARGLIEATPFDLAILDETGQDGDCGRIIALLLERNPDIPVIALTANDVPWPSHLVRRTFVKTRTPEQKIVVACLNYIRARPRQTRQAAE